MALELEKLKVTLIDLDQNGTGVASTEEVVAANTLKDFYIHDRRMLTTVEMPHEDGLPQEKTEE